MDEKDYAAARRHLVERHGLTAEGAAEVIALLTEDDRAQDFADGLAVFWRGFVERAGVGPPALAAREARIILDLFERRDPASQLTLVAVHDLLFGTSGTVGVPDMRRLRQAAEAVLRPHQAGA